MSSVFPRAWLLASAASTLLVSAAHAQSTYRFDLPSQPLSVTIRSIGHQTGFNILVDSQAGEMIAPPLKGEMTVAEALDRLTAGRGVAVQSVDGRSFFIGHVRPSPSLAPTALQASDTIGQARPFNEPSPAAAPSPVQQEAPAVATPDQKV